MIGSWIIESLADSPAAEVPALASDLICDVRYQLDLDTPEPNRAFEPQYPKT